MLNNVMGGIEMCLGTRGGRRFVLGGGGGAGISNSKPIGSDIQDKTQDSCLQETT